MLDPDALEGVDGEHLEHSPSLVDSRKQRIGLKSTTISSGENNQDQGPASINHWLASTHHLSQRFKPRIDVDYSKVGTLATPPPLPPRCSDDSLDATDSSGRWKVVGGADTGGIVVRKSWELCSSVLDSKLQTDAVIRVVTEARISKNGKQSTRLCYQLINGKGPKEGWVSLTVNGKDMVTREPSLLVRKHSEPSAEHATAKGDSLPQSHKGHRSDPCNLPNLSPSLFAPEASRPSTERVTTKRDSPRESREGHPMDSGDPEPPAMGIQIKDAKQAATAPRCPKPSVGARLVALEPTETTVSQVQVPLVSIPLEAHTSALSQTEEPPSTAEGHASQAMPSNSLSEGNEPGLTAPLNKPVCLLNTDALGTLRGSCSCGKCQAWSQNGRASISWRTSTCGDTRGTIKTQDCGCQRCGCSAEKHKCLTSWLTQVRICLARFRDTGYTTKRPLPMHSCLPVEALGWDTDGVALHVLTSGKYHPDRHKPEALRPSIDRECLLSVCVPTSGQRHVFHPLMYENFKRQTYEPKELVVVDTSLRGPSSYLLEQARLDPRVIYCHLRAEDATDERREVHMRRIYMRQLVEDGKFGRRAGGVPPPVLFNLDAWSLGLKRNVCCHLSRGAVIAHFDDDDLYSPDYLKHMYRQLQSAVAAKERKELVEDLRFGEIKAIATLSEWHMLDIDKDFTFRYMNPKTEDMPEMWRQPMIDGYGFSYVYTRAAWDLQAFPDRETCEDDVFMECLKKQGTLVQYVELPFALTGLVAHAFHSLSTSGGEWNGQKRCGKVVSTPEAFRSLLPILRSVSRSLPNGGAACPPVQLGTLVGPSAGKGTGKWKGPQGGKGQKKGKSGLRTQTQDRFIYF